MTWQQPLAARTSNTCTGPVHSSWCTTPAAVVLCERVICWDPAPSAGRPETHAEACSNLRGTVGIRSNFQAMSNGHLSKTETRSPCADGVRETAFASGLVRRLARYCRHMTGTAQRLFPERRP